MPLRYNQLKRIYSVVSCFSLIWDSKFWSEITKVDLEGNTSQGKNYKHHQLCKSQ